MHKTWRFILAAVGVLAVLGLSSSGAFAQDGASTELGAVKRYVLMSSSGTWGTAQTDAITRMGGTIGFSHAASGIGSAASADAEFLNAIMRTGAFSRAAKDFSVQWQDPTLRVAEEQIEEDVVTPGDETFINAQWNYIAVDAPGAWASGYTGTGARVAVLDGGIHSTHVDLDANIDVAASASMVPGFAYNQDVGTFWHGTHVAGIVAAEDNGIGTIGIAPNATIIGVKVLHNGSGSFEAVIAGILYAADDISEGGGGADIINMSLGATFAKGGGNTGAGALVAAMNQAVNYATGKGVLVISSAGNSAIDMDHSGSITNVPAQSGSGLAISATGPMGFAVGWPAGATDYRRFASYSNWGHQLVSLAAPGGDFALPGNANCSIPRCCGGPALVVPCWVFDMVLSTSRGTGASVSSYSWAAGTSMAAPAASAVAALIVQKYPGISSEDLKNRLMNTADDEGAIGADPFYGHGFVNANRAVNDAAPLASSKPEKQEIAAGASKIELVVGRNASATPEISFTMPASGPARLDLYDVAGRRVAELFNGQASAGRNVVAWAVQLRPGAYFARLTAGNVMTARQVVMLSE